jgi:hypothetical protein
MDVNLYLLDSHDRLANKNIKEKLLRWESSWLVCLVASRNKIISRNQPQSNGSNDCKLSIVCLVIWFESYFFIYNF